MPLSPRYLTCWAMDGILSGTAADLLWDIYSYRSKTQTSPSRRRHHIGLRTMS
ncbi:hypothetical protein BDZ97DRAFT_1846676 [Flammula alnicola]|nr:hypothetical protein BDZ97DRAFT_1846676 [Flammula alnicola]